MAPQPPPDSPQRSSVRVPVAGQVQLRFERFSGFISEYAANLSLGGMFVRTRQLKPVGTVLHFEFQLADGYALIRGQGEVVWTRWRDQGEEAPAGMGVRFLDLDPESARLIATIVAERAKEGEAAFDLATAASEPAPPPEPPEPETHAPPEPAPPVPSPDWTPARLSWELDPLPEPVPETVPAPPATQKPRPATPLRAGPRRRRPAARLALAALVVVAAGAGILLVVRGRTAPTGAPAAPGAAASADPAGPPPPGDREAGPPPPAAAPQTPPPAPVAVAAAPTATAAAFRAVRRVTWATAAGATVVTVWTDGAVAEGRYSHFRLDGPPPREVVKLRGVASSTVPPRLEVATPELLQIRTGLHRLPSGDELHLVLDLGSPATRLVTVTAAGDRLELRLVSMSAAPDSR